MLAKVALVNETFVREWLGGAEPIGALLRTAREPGYAEATYEIIGVVRDAKYGKTAERHSTDCLRAVDADS
jgi:hypothetical protein